ncbi:MAG: preprotein translocase subunit SecG [Ruminococcaceae bacterium]|nr:preprotein translocase subunit SecG [Oscillospiraceae bacterium]
MFNNPSVVVTLIVQIILSLILIVAVLFQNSNQEGLSGAIAGGAETFFGKNKGRTVDAKLKKLTTVVAILFLISSVLLGLFVQRSMPKAETTIPAGMMQPTGAPVDIQPVADGTVPADAGVVPSETENVETETVETENVETETVETETVETENVEEGTTAE